MDVEHTTTSGHILQMEKVSKRFPGVLANDTVDFTVREGEIHALLGENGAGKTTLMNVLYGLYQPDEGQIYVRSKPVYMNSPHDAIDLGIGMVHQHFMLIPVLSVIENVVLGLPPGKGPILDLKTATAKLKAISEDSGLTVDPAAKIMNLPVGVQQRVEICKFLYRGADFLILDEPTAVLTPEEVERLFAILRQLQAKGVTIVLITHKLNEVMAVSDRVTVLRKGRKVATVDTINVSRHELAQMMVGREVLFEVDKEPAHIGRPVLEIDRLTVLDERKIKAVNTLSLEVFEGEILGIAGVSGNGQEELAEALGGVRHPIQGSIKLFGKDITYDDPRTLIEAGVSQIPSDRKSMGSIPDFTIAENTVLPTFYKKPYSRHNFINWNAIKSHGKALIEEYDIKTSGPDVPAGWLSGGNLQKLILARQIALEPKLLVAVQPTRGLDVGAIEFVHKRLIDERDRGVGILLISTDIEEILNISDRIAVIYNGTIVGVVDAEEADLHEIALLMAGVTDSGEEEKGT